MDTQLFEEAKRKVIGIDRPRAVIGTLGEKSVHAVLKHYFEPYPDNHEIKLGSFYADIVGEDGIIEIQTRGAYKLREKLTYFLAVSRVTLVIPIAVSRRLVWIDPETGETSNGRKSNAKGRAFDALAELGGIADLLGHRNLSVCVVLLEVCDYKLLDGYGEKRKLRASKFDRIPERLVDEIYLNVPEDYFQLLPDNFPDEFVVSDIIKLTKAKSRQCYSAVKALEKVGICTRDGNVGRSRKFRLTGKP